MKIKCPGCAATLQIPDSAAGKVVKCKCGKQLRAPGGPAATAQAAAPPQQRPAPAASPGLFDELTDSDLSPIKAVQIPGAKAATKAPTGSAAKLLDDAISGSDRRVKRRGMKGETPRPPLLTFIGALNGLCAVLFGGVMLLFIGLIDVELPIDGQVPEGAEGAFFFLMAILLGLMALLSLATCIACFVRGIVPWYIILASYGWAVAFRISEVAQEIIDGTADATIVGAIGGILIASGIWAWLHGKSVKAYYQTEGEPVWRIAVIDVVGFLAAAGLWAAAMLVA